MRRTPGSRVLRLGLSGDGGPLRWEAEGTCPA